MVGPSTHEVVEYWLQTRNWPLVGWHGLKLKDPDVTRLRLSLPDDAMGVLVRELLNVGKTWHEAMQVVRWLESQYAWGSKQKRERFAAMAKDPLLLTALQAATLMGTTPRVSILAVLAADGGELSIDAMMPVFAAESKDELLRDAKVHAAKTPGMQVFFDTLAHRIATRDDSSPATVFFSELLGEKLKRIELFTHLSPVSRARAGGQFTVSSMQRTWWTLSMHDLPERATWNSDMTFENDPLGFTGLRELPKWLKTMATRARIEWHPHHLTGSLRGKKKDALMAWLYGG